MAQFAIPALVQTRTAAIPPQIGVGRSELNIGRLEFLDGVRGVAALMVVICHLPTFSIAPGFVVAASLGNPWVSIFITLSGFCLYLPSARRETVALSRPFWGFMRRRAQRILPAWYASLVLCLFVGWLLQRVGLDGVSRGFMPHDALDLPAHLLLVHSMTVYSGSINGPGYTLGTEWQLYWLMLPFLWVARRWGWLVLVAAVALLALPYPGISGNVLHKVFSPTFTGPFVIGILAARLVYHLPNGLGRKATAYTTANILLLTVLATIVLYFVTDQASHDLASWMAATATGAGCIFMAQRPLSLGARLFGSFPGRTLGSFAYSLYLTHFPLLALLTSIATTLGVTSGAMFYTVVLPSLPLIVGFAYLFYRLFERPFLPGRGDSGSTASLAAFRVRNLMPGLQLSGAGRSSRSDLAGPDRTQPSGLSEAPGA